MFVSIRKEASVVSVCWVKGRIAWGQEGQGLPAHNKAMEGQLYWSHLA